jgi:hypothetical protein
VRGPIAGVVLTISVPPSGKVQLKVVERAAVEFGTRGNIESQEHLDGRSAKLGNPHSTPVLCLTGCNIISKMHTPRTHAAIHLHRPNTEMRVYTRDACRLSPE